MIILQQGRGKHEHNNAGLDRNKTAYGRQGRHACRAPKATESGGLFVVTEDKAWGERMREYAREGSAREPTTGWAQLRTPVGVHISGPCCCLVRPPAAEGGRWRVGSKAGGKGGEGGSACVRACVCVRACMCVACVCVHVCVCMCVCACVCRRAESRPQAQVECR